MKKIIYIAFGLFTLAACNNSSIKSTDQTPNQAEKLGSDKDDHGCLGSAGQTWSSMKQDCIQLFNVGFRLNPVNSLDTEAIISAFIIWSEDDTKLELFLPEDIEHSHILTKNGDDVYENGNYKYDSHTSKLYSNGKLIYQGDVE